MPPLQLNDEEMDLLRALASPIAYGRRHEFPQEVAAALEASPEPGPGAIYGVGRDIQRRFVLQAQRVAASDTPSAWRA